MLEKGEEVLTADNVPLFAKEAKRLAKLDVGSNQAICELAAKVKTSDVDSLGTLLVAHAVLLKAAEERKAEIAHQRKLAFRESMRSFYEGGFLYFLLLTGVGFIMGAVSAIVAPRFNLPIPLSSPSDVIYIAQFLPIVGGIAGLIFAGITRSLVTQWKAEHLAWSSLAGIPVVTVGAVAVVYAVIYIVAFLIAVAIVIAVLAIAFAIISEM